ncbi:Fpg/Nei family DNA glycosylase [Corynebacterium pygosceleis]|uniref:DNA-(apurinic or apyrimidinic site) lyase n=1 Tax=Corynebacterium pygosceleis TaxID=2800406 RepID=A0A9Q4CAI6_9CORY|nr:Fpg/Nei family DNA glycosylase [Corynebacterium pygosceleis]MCK7637166.1 Fpg/Nei family DNA glycosylase [Corynebacterium pygosceleis]MCL0120059.1 Fpg/Nei family DNA glycosylase [Corynebacterium pygosceleis]MCX7445069.1 Fpg/Nei family DNA glycosylase [Corynebacterium pygosceleis]MCX7469419.1 Fpg/Nei family DNA glycosylase [Corynebacterium pygosceleis]
MPEGHVIHRLAERLTTTFDDRELEFSSPQGRFSTEASHLDGHRITLAEAWGKQLFIDVEHDHPEHIIHIHLGLIGGLGFTPYAAPTGQVRLRITDRITAADLRGPQWCRLITDAERDAAVAKLGADPLRPDADPDPIWTRVHRSGKSIGALMMDQKLFAGVGNIYRAEVLFRLGLDPRTPGQALDRSDFDAIWDELVTLMADGVRAGRIDTVRPEHTPEAMHREPREDDHGGEVYVYRRAAQPCHICTTPVETTVLEGRNLFWCPRCQGGN